MIPRPRLRRRFRLPDRTRPLPARPEGTCVVCGAPAVRAPGTSIVASHSGMYCPNHRPVYQHHGDLAPNSGASR